jgi:hypothetical protein
MTNSSVERIDTSGAGKSICENGKGEEVLKQRSYSVVGIKTNLKRQKK